MGPNLLTPKKWAPIIQSMSQGTFITGLGIILIGVWLPSDRDDLILHGLIWTTVSAAVYMLAHSSLRWFTMRVLWTKMKWRRFKVRAIDRLQFWRTTRRWARYAAMWAPLQNALERGVRNHLARQEQLFRRAFGDPPEPERTRVEDARLVRVARDRERPPGGPARHGVTEGANINGDIFTAEALEQAAAAIPRRIRVPKPAEFIKIKLVIAGYKQTVVDGRLVRRPILNKEDEDGKKEPQQRRRRRRQVDEGGGVAYPAGVVAPGATFPRADQF